MEYEPGSYITTSVYISTLAHDPVAVGVVERLTPEGALISITTPLQQGDTLRVFLIDHKHPPEQVERHAEVEWVREAFNPEKELIAECQVRWVAVGGR